MSGATDGWNAATPPRCGVSGEALAVVTEWGWRDLDSGDVLAILNNAAAAAALASEHCDHIVSRQRTTYADDVTEWSPAEPHARIADTAEQEEA